MTGMTDRSGSTGSTDGGVVFTGKSVEEAVAEGLRSLGLTQDQAEVEVLNRGSRGLFGIGSEPAQVRITPRRAQPRPSAPAAPAAPAAPPVSHASDVTPPPTRPDRAESVSDRQPSTPAETAPAAPPAGHVSGVTPPAQPDRAESVSDRTPPAPAETASAAPSAGHVSDVTSATETGATDEEAGEEADEEAGEAEMAALAVELLSETVRHMGFDAEVVASWQEPDADNDERYLLLNLHGRDLGALIGRRGETLSNLQYLLRLMVNQRLHQWKNIVVDVEQYRQRRAEHLTQLALRSADQVATSGRPLSLEPMPPNERRLIHLALRDHPGVYTESSGEGERRKIQILPKRGA